MAWLDGLAHVGKKIFILRSYEIFYLTSFKKFVKKNSDVKPWERTNYGKSSVHSCWANVLILFFNIWKKKLIKENTVTPYRTGPLALVYMENFHLTWMGSQQNQLESHLGGLAHFSYEHNVFLKEFVKEGDISPRWTSLPNRASLPVFKQPLYVKGIPKQYSIEIISPLTRVNLSFKNPTFYNFQNIFLEIFNCNPFMTSL